MNFDKWMRDPAFANHTEIMQAINKIAKRVENLHDTVGLVGPDTVDELKGLVEELSKIEIPDVLSRSQIQGMIDTTIHTLEESVAKQLTPADVQSLILTSLDNFMTSQIQPTLTTIINDIATLKKSTSDLSLSISVLRTEFETYVPEIDFSAVNAMILHVQDEVDSLRNSANTSNTDLLSEIDTLADTLSILQDKVTTIIADGEDEIDIDPALLVSLQDQIDAMDERVSVIATDHDMRALVSRVEDIENIAYHFEGTSQDVIDFIDEHSVRALRFFSEYNLALNANKTYAYVSNSNGETDWTAYINYLLSGNWGNNPYNNVLERSFTTLSRNSLVKLSYTDSLLTTLNLKGKSISIRINPAYGLQNEDGTMKDPTNYLIVRFEGIVEGDTTHNNQLNIRFNELIDGQVDVKLPENFTKLSIVFAPSKVGEYSYAKYPKDSILLSSLLPIDKTIADNQFMGIWIVD